MKLSEFIAAYMLPAFQQGRDYTGPRGWCHLTNLLLRRLESEGMDAMGRVVETPIPVQGEYYLPIPSDYRFGERVYIPAAIAPYETAPAGSDIDLEFEELGGRIRLTTAVPPDVTGSIYLSTRTDNFTATASCTGGIPEEWKGDNALVGKAIRILDSTQYAVITTSTYPGTGELVSITTDRSIADLILDDDYDLISMYVILRYRSTFTPLALAEDEIPLDDRYEFLLASWLQYQCEAYDAKMRQAYQLEFETEIVRVMDEVCTPTTEEARPRSRYMPGLAAL